MSCFLCETCGTQYAESEAPPAACIICCDERQYVGVAGQSWITMEALSARHEVCVRDDDGLPGVGLSPSFAINQRALVLETAGLRVLWECVSAVSAAAVKEVTARGPIEAIAISHPHFYSSMVEWSDALGGVPIYVHEADRRWVTRPAQSIVFWRGETHRLADGVTLIRCPGHFDGSAVLHWQDSRRPKGALFSGDALQVTADRRHVSFMYSYPNLIPMDPDAVVAIGERLRGFAFDDVYGYTWKRNIIGGGRRAVDVSIERYLSAVGRGRADMRALVGV